ncbi:MAG: SusD/RagB family nutrient-binding outer membrane lipoprotein [Bacteroidales bacterium]
MKKIYISLIIGLLLFPFYGCNKFIDPEINENPDNPTEATPELLLSSIQARMGYTTIGGNDAARLVNIWMQQITGINRQSLSTAYYIVRAEDGNNYWNANYAGTMMDIVQLRSISDKLGSEHYSAVADVLMALSLAYTTDLWGDIPYTEAFRGDEALSPSYDTQESIYEAIDNLLSDAIMKFQMDPGDLPINSNYDFIFRGDIEKWINIVYALKARYYIHRSKVDDKYYDMAEKAALMTDLAMDNNMIFNFYNSPGQDNPFYQFQSQRQGDVVSCSTLVDLLKREFPLSDDPNALTIQDPRLSKYVEPIKDTIVVSSPEGNKTYYPGDYLGAIPGSGDTRYSSPGEAIASPNSPVVFIANFEILYILSEISFNKGEFQMARDYALEATTRSLQFYNAFNVDFIDAYRRYLDGLDSGLLFKEIIIGKYLALYLHLEVYNDFRRTNNVIGLVPNTQVPGNSEIPRRYIYPTSEVDLNRNTPREGDTPYNPIWWDRN